MSEFLVNYGAGEERRNKRIVRAVLVFLIAVVVATFAYFWLRNRSEQAKLDGFRQVLASKDYAAAYRYWGCTPQTPCPNYPYEKFLEDWGEKSGHTDLAKLEVVRQVTCKAGFGQSWKFGDDTVHLWVVREDQAMSYDPWPNWRQTWIAAIFNDCSGLERTLPTRKR